MKKKGLVTALIAGTVLSLSGCAYQQNYLKKYSKELEAVFGAYESEALGKQNDYGFNGLGEHSYKAWEITYTDATGEEKVYELRNDENFDFAIGRLYTENVRTVMKKTLLADCMEAGSVNETYCDISFHVDLSKHFYTDNSKDTITVGGDYIKEGDYEQFNMEAMDCEQLIKDGVVTIHKLEFRRRMSHETPPTEEDIAYFKALVEDFEEIVPVESAYYLALYTDYNEDDTIPLKEEQECAAVQSSADSNEGNES